jgi:GT2 family glycosyltransferase
MNLSIIIATINDQDETLATIKSIRETAGDVPEIVLVDDCSGSPLAGDWRFKGIPNLKLISNRHRCGCGPSRHIGVLNASGDWCLLTDSHMRFDPTWWAAWQRAVSAMNMDTIYCATCLGLDRDHMDVNAPVAEYSGATINWHGPDRQDPRKMQTLEVVWLPKEQWPDHMAECASLMGAGYFISRDWFLHLGACCHLRSWGQDELFLSLKSWLSGGSVRMLRTVRIGHKFPVKGELKWFNLPPGHVARNKILAAHTLFPPDVAKRLVEWILTPQDKTEMRDIEAARGLVIADWPIVAAEIARNGTIFKRDIAWICSKFNLPMP